MCLRVGYSAPTVVLVQECAIAEGAISRSTASRPLFRRRVFPDVLRVKPWGLGPLTRLGVRSAAAKGLCAGSVKERVYAGTLSDGGTALHRDLPHGTWHALGHHLSGGLASHGRPCVEAVQGQARPSGPGGHLAGDQQIAKRETAPWMRPSHDRHWSLRARDLFDEYHRQA